MGSCPYCKTKINEIEIREVVVCKHYAINIADTSGMQDACHMNFAIDLAHRLCGSVVRAFESEIRRSEIRFLMGT